MLITLTKDEMERCLEFSYKCAENQQAIEFGQSDTIPRSTKEIGRDNLIGKMAEIAFASMMKSTFHIAIPLDFEYYPRGQWDGQDTIINGWKIDIKATRQGGRWMLIEWSKINFRQKDNDLSHLFAMASVKWNRDTDTPTGVVEMVGSASILKLKPGVENTHILRKGEPIPGTTQYCRLNYGIRFEHLQNDWNMVIKYILEHAPLDLSDYPNPYTGKPMDVQNTAKESNINWMTKFLTKIGLRGNG